MKQFIVFLIIWFCLVSFGCNIAQSKSKDNSWPEYNQAIKHMKKAEYKEALQLANDRIKIYPNEDKACWVKGKTYYLMENWEEAIRWIQRSKFLNPNWKKEYTGSYLRKALKKQKSNIDNWSEYNKATEYMKKAEYKDALKLANDRLKIYPNEVNACWVKGKTYYLMENWGEAIKWLQRTEFLYPDWKRKYTSSYLRYARKKAKKQL